MAAIATGGTAASGPQKQHDTSGKIFYAQGCSVRAIQIRNFFRKLGLTSVGGRDSGCRQQIVIAAAENGP